MYPLIEAPPVLLGCCQLNETAVPVTPAAKLRGAEGTLIIAVVAVVAGDAVDDPAALTAMTVAV